jgi:hypothetical protein
MLVKLLLAVSIVANLVFAILLFDAAVSLDAARMQQRALETRQSGVIQLLNDCFVGKPVTEVLAGLDEAQRKRWLVKWQGPDLLVGDLVFATKDDLVVSVKYLGED